MAGEYTALEKLHCLQRELLRRRRLFPGRIKTGRMKKADADRELRIMEAITQDYTARAREIADDEATPAPDPAQGRLL
jgi:hypothetical protein